MNDMQLKCFMTAAKYENFTKASEELYISQPVIGRHISHLEDELGFELFHRERKTVRLTENGFLFLEFLKECETKFDSFMAKAEANLRSADQTLLIGIAEGQILVDAYPDIFQTILQKVPELTVVVSFFLNFKMIEALKNGTIDLAVLALEDIEADLSLYNYKILSEVHCGVVLPSDHPAAHKETIQASDLENDTFILLSEKDSEVAMRAQMKTIRTLGIKKHIVAPNISTLSLWVESGMGITTIDYNHKLCNSRNLVFRPLITCNPFYEVCAWRKDNTNSAIQIFCDIIDSLGYGKKTDAKP